MLDGNFLYNAIRDEEIIVVGFEVKNTWENGKPTDKKKIMVRCYIAHVDSTPIEVRIMLPMDRGYLKALKAAIGHNIGVLEGVIGPIDTRAVYNYQGPLKTSYIGISTDCFSVCLDDDEIEL